MDDTRHGLPSKIYGFPVVIDETMNSKTLSREELILRLAQLIHEVEYLKRVLHDCGEDGTLARWSESYKLAFAKGARRQKMLCSKAADQTVLNYSTWSVERNTALAVCEAVAKAPLAEDE